VIDHDNQIVNVDFDDGDKTISVPFNLVNLQDGYFGDETLSLDQSLSTTTRRKHTPKTDYKWCHEGGPQPHSWSLLPG
jgi:hypothetical protein